LGEQFGESLRRCVAVSPTAYRSGGANPLSDAVACGQHLEKVLTLRRLLWPQAITVANRPMLD
jgi:hypothetical protein